MQPVVNLHELKLEPFTQGTGYESLDGGISELFGLTQLGAVLTPVPPGKSACPYHVHHVEDELFFILEGTGEYRFGKDVFAVKAGDLLGAPRGGPEYAHKLINTGATNLRYLALSSKAHTEVCEYPDSGKFYLRTPESPTTGQPFEFVGRNQDRRDYWEDEDGA